MRHHEDEVSDGFAELFSRPHSPSVERTRFAQGTREIERLRENDTVATDDFALAERVEQIVHDLKGPLQTIALETCLLDDKLAPDDLETRSAIARISRNVFFLDRLVQDLVDFGSLEAGRLELRRKPTELRALIARAIDRLVPTRDHPRIFFELSAKVVVAVDELRIERVFANLLQNALKYAPRNSRITIRIGVAGELARISVSDAGPGLTGDETTHVFDKYRRGSSSVGHEGSGLGLYICKQIVEAHGGTIGVTSVEGLGSQFFFELPVT
jgi:signal transduction histidine kinase